MSGFPSGLPTGRSPQKPARLPGIDLLFAAVSLAIFGADLLLPAGRAIIVLLIIVVILAGRSNSPKRVLVWTVISILLTLSGYVIRHGAAYNPVYMVRRAICVLALLVAASVILRNQWLERARRERSALLEKAAAAILVRDHHDTIISWSKGAELLYGWTAAEVLGRRSSDIFPNTDPAALQNAGNALAAAGRWQGELHRQTASGRQIIVLCHWAAQKNGKGDIAAILESNTDITVRKFAEASIRSSEARFRGIFEMAGAAIWEEDYTQAEHLIANLKAKGVTDFSRYFRSDPAQARDILNAVRVTGCNQAALALLQAPNSEALKQRQGDVILNGLDDAFAEYLAAAAEGRGSFHTETIFVTWQGERRNVILSAAFGAGEASRNKVLVSAMDITERKQVENSLIISKEKLSHLTRSATLGELTTLISAEVERPLTAIVEHSRAAGAILHSGTWQTESLDALIQHIIEDARYASGVVANIRTFLRRNIKGNGKIAIAGLVEAVIALLERELSFYGVALELRIEPGLPEIASETGWLEHVILYIMLNCIQDLAQANRQNRNLTLSVCQQNSEIVIRFESHSRRLGSIFRQTDGGEKQADHPGRDIGYAICRSSVEARGGRIVLSPRAGPDAGIEVIFPI